MAARPFWKGYMKLSLVTCPVAMMSATSEEEKVRFHVLNRRTGNRILSQYVDAETGKPVDEANEVKGYARGEDDYVLLEDEELESVALESARTIDIQSFVAAESIDWIWYDTPYYLTPDDPIGEEAYCVIRDAMRSTAMVGVSRLVLNRRERAVILKPRDNGIVLWTLRFGDEVRDPGEYFASIREVKPDAGADAPDRRPHQVAQESLEPGDGRRSGASAAARHHRGEEEGREKGQGETEAPSPSRRQATSSTSWTRCGEASPPPRSRRGAREQRARSPLAEPALPAASAPRSAPRRRGNPPTDRRQARRGASACCGW